MSNLHQNERSWCIEIISEINGYVGNKKISISKASGESTITGLNRYPDIILYGPPPDNELLQIWEIKLPDTSIYNSDPKELAVIKATKLGINSFTLWNGREAAIFALNEEKTFEEIWHKTYPNIVSRSDLENRDAWLNPLYEIVDSVQVLLTEGRIKPLKPSEVLKDAVYGRYVEELLPNVKLQLISKCVNDRQFKEEVDRWWLTSPSSHGDSKDEKFESLARIVIVGWINRFLFSHYLRRHFSDANDVLNIDSRTDVKDALKVFNRIGVKSGYPGILSNSLGSDCVDGMAWDVLCELNSELGAYMYERILEPEIQSLLKAATDITTRDMSGQYCTPPELARFLVGISIKNSNGVVIDPCCGTGTIVREALYNRICSDDTRSISDNALWAFDKFQPPLSLATMMLIDDRNPDVIPRVFQCDVFDLSVGKEFLIHHPDGSQETCRLPEVDTIVSNLPFVRFEVYKELNKDTPQIDTGLSKADLYAHILLSLDKILSEEGRIGVIVSNSWISTDWSKTFKNELLKRYEIESVVVSGSGRWFKDASVVATILILRSRRKEFTLSETIRFITTNSNIETWSLKNSGFDSILKEMVNDIWTSNPDSKAVTVYEHSIDDLRLFETLGLGPMIAFTDTSWIRKLQGRTEPIENYFEVTRGSRGGWNDFLYPPADCGIDEEFLHPLLKDPKSLDGLTARTDRKVFICDADEETLIENNETGTLAWIHRHSDDRLNNNGNARITPRTGHPWYSAAPPPQVDMVLLINPYKRIFVSRFEERSHIDQRFIGLTHKGKGNLDLIHALMNSTLGMLFIESWGFGRGDGVLDLNQSKIKNNLRILNPVIPDKEQSERILRGFRALKQRRCRDLEIELQSEDRIQFDEAVLDAYGLKDCRLSIESSLRRLYSIRLAVKQDEQKNRPRESKKKSIRRI